METPVCALADVTFSTQHVFAPDSKSTASLIMA